MGLNIRDWQDSDLAAIQKVNEANVPHVNFLTVNDLSILAHKTSYFKVVELDGELAGFLMAMLPGVDYASDNYQWFSRHYQHFVYIDRVITLTIARGKGVASLLYKDIEKFADSCRAPLVCCEVNSKPANEESLRFHQTRGYREVGTQQTEGGSKTVSLLAKKLRVN